MYSLVEKFRSSHDIKPSSGLKRTMSMLGCALLTNLLLLSAIPQAIPQAMAQSLPQKSCRWHPGHYLFMGDINQPTSEIARFLKPDSPFRGVQKTYTWSALEPSPGQYNFALIKSDLAYLRSQNKRLVVQIWLKTFQPERGINHPSWLKGSPNPSGGCYSASFRTAKGGYSLAFWDPAVAHRVALFYNALGKELSRDANVSALEIVNADETATLGENGEAFAAAAGTMPYNQTNLGRNLMYQFKALNDALPHTVAIQFVNWPTNLVPYFVDQLIYMGGGIGGPDLDPDYHTPAYDLLPSAAGLVPLGFAVQWKDTFTNGMPDDRSEVIRTLQFARSKKLNYVFWMNRKGYMETVESVLKDAAVVDQKDPAGGLVRCYPLSVVPLTSSSPVAP